MEYFFFYLECPSNWEELKDELIKNTLIHLFFDAKYIICEEHLKVAIDRSVRSMERKVNIAKKFGIEVMVHLSGQHQIQSAMKLFDIGQSTHYIILVQSVNSTIIADSKPGLPTFNKLHEIYQTLAIASYDPCKEIIAKSARLTVDYE